MDKFKAKLKRRIALLGCLAVIYLAANILLYTFIGVKGGDDASDFIQGFQFGIGFFILAVLIYFIAQYLSALRSADALKKIYIAENDERRKMILQKSGSIGMKTAIFGLAGAAVLAGFINTTVFFTLVGASLFVALTNAALKLYYKNKF